jgi:tetratricopeptide (TPR) repeat protein
VVAQVEKLFKGRLGLAQARQAGVRFYDGLMVQLRSMGPGLWADRWLFEQVPELRGLQAAVLQSQVQQNVPCLNAEVDKMSPAEVVKACRAMNAAYAFQAAELVGIPPLTIPYQAAGLEALAKELIAITSIEEASFDASLLPEGSRTPGTEKFHRAVTDTFQRSYAGMGGQLSVVFAAGRIEVAWEPAAPEAPAMATIGPLLQQRRFDEARPLLETLLQLQPEHPEALYNLGVLASEEGRLEEARLLLRRAWWPTPTMPTLRPMRRWRWDWPPCGRRTAQKPGRPWRQQSSWRRTTPLPCAASPACR